MSGDFKTDVWQGTTALGGLWNWDNNIGGFTAGISIQGYTCPTAQLLEIDAKIDDGDLTTGNFRLVPPNRAMLILEY